VSVNNGQDANQDTFNNAFMSRTTDTSTTGEVDLENANAASGPGIENAQRSINGVHNFVGSAPEGTYDQDPSWSSDALTGTVANESIKDRIDAVQAVVEDHDANKVDAVVGTDNALIRNDGTAGAIQNSGIIVDDSNNITGVNDLTIAGDLTVNGTTTTINTATLDVEDVNITINKGGDQATAEATAGLTIEMSDATDAKIIYDSSVTSKFKIGESGSEVEVATISGSQVFTDKDIDGGTASNTSRLTLPKNTTTNLSGLTRKEGTIAYDEDKDKPVFDDGSNFIELASLADIVATGGNNEPSQLVNMGIAASASSGALTIAIKQSDGSTDASTGDNAVKIGFRSSSATSGAFNIRQLTGALSLVIPSGATLGYASGSDTYAHVYAIDNSGSIELATIGFRRYDDEELVNTTAIDTASDDGGTLYSSTARTNVPCRYLGYIRINSMTTAGTWTTPDFISIFENKNIFEKIESSSGLTNYTITAGTWGDVTSIVLSPGTWTISCHCIFFANGAITTTSVALGISSTSGNSTPGADGVNHLFSVANTSTFQSTPITVVDVVVTETEETTYYLKGLAGSSITNLQIGYKITALRLK